MRETGKRPQKNKLDDMNEKYVALSNEAGQDALGDENLTLTVDFLEPTPSFCVFYRRGPLRQSNRPFRKVTQMRCSPRHWTTVFCLFAAFCVFPRTTHATFIDDFEDGDATDGSPVTWVPSATYSGGTREVVDGDYVIGHNSAASSVVEGSDELADISICTQLRIVASSGAWVFPGVFARAQEGAPR